MPDAKRSQTATRPEERNRNLHCAVMLMCTLAGHHKLANCLYLFFPTTWAMSVSALILDTFLQKWNFIGVFFLSSWRAPAAKK